MKIQSPPGMRDFYPDQMCVQNWLFDLWRSVSRSYGFQEYEGPIFEYLDLYRLKSGEGIVSEVFAFQDRGGREFAIRPEMTPTLARMVAARANALPRPIKWFSIPRMCRAEKPQRGRLREFFQWNADVLGSEDALADAEVIAVAVEFFRRAGLRDEEFVVRVNHRELAAEVLAAHGIDTERQQAAFQLIDRADRLGELEFARQWNESFAASLPADSLRALLADDDLERCCAHAQRAGQAGAAAAQALRQLWERLEQLGVRPACAFDLSIVRGLAYYTGTVFEAHMRQGGLRALAGGGRYDNLTGLLDGPRVPGVGFGMGDAPVLEALRQLGRLPQASEQLDVFVIDADANLFPRALTITQHLRRAGLAADYSYRRATIGKQLKEAAGRRARFALIIGEELDQRGELGLKDLETGAQRAVRLDTITSDPRAVIGVGGPMPGNTGVSPVA
ncbi:MAG: histidine--tRNA ligase [Phycisphaerae bacterium]